LAARALRLDEKIGNFQPGKEADFVVIDPAVTPLQRLRSGRCKDIYEQLFVLMTLGDERNISETWVNGERVWDAAAVARRRLPGYQTTRTRSAASGEI
jgi:guanine deaminase